MKLKNVALLVAALTCIAGSTALAAEKVNIKAPMPIVMTSFRS